MVNTKETSSKAGTDVFREHAERPQAAINTEAAVSGRNDVNQDQISAEAARLDLIEAAFLERTSQQNAIKAVVASLRNVSHLVEVRCAVRSLKDAKATYPRIGIQVLDQAEFDNATQVLDYLYDLRTILTMERLHKSGILRVILEAVVHKPSADEPLEFLVPLVNKVKRVIKTVYRHEKGVKKTDFEWNIEQVADLMQQELADLDNPLEWLQAFYATFTLRPGVSVGTDVGFEDLSEADILDELSQLEDMLTTMKNFADDLHKTLVFRYKLEGLREMAGRLEKGLEKLLFSEGEVAQRDKDELHTIIAALARHVDLLPDLDSLFQDVPEFLWMTRRLVHARLIAEPALGRVGTRERIEQIYFAVHPNPATVQLRVGYVKKCAKEVVYKKTPLFSDSLDLYHKDFRPIDQKPSVNPYPVDDDRIHSASLAVRSLYNEAMDGIAAPAREYLLLEACRAAEKGLDILEGNCLMTVNRVLKLGETTLVRNLRHNWELIPGKNENLHLYARILFVKKRCAPLSATWHATFCQARDHEDTLAKKRKLDGRRELRGKRADKAGRNGPSRR